MAKITTLHTPLDLEGVTGASRPALDRPWTAHPQALDQQDGWKKSKKMRFPEIFSKIQNLRFFQNFYISQKVCRLKFVFPVPQRAGQRERREILSTLFLKC